MTKIRKKIRRIAVFGLLALILMNLSGFAMFTLIKNVVGEALMDYGVYRENDQLLIIIFGSLGLLYVLGFKTSLREIFD